MKKEKNNYEEYCQDVLLEVKKEFREHDPVAQRCKYISFVSESNGRRRKKRRVREVSFLIVDGRSVYQIINGELKPKFKNKRRVSWASSPDRLAEEILTDVPLNERTPDMLIARAQKLTE
jgi:hypothetical protein